MSWHTGTVISDLLGKRPWKVMSENWTGGIPVYFQDDVHFATVNRVEGTDALAIARLIEAAPDLAGLLLESRESIGGDWRARRDSILKKAGLL